MVVAVPSVFMVSGEVRGTATTPEPDMYAVLGSMPHDQNSAGHLWTISTNPSASYIARRIGLTESMYQNMRLCSSLIDPQCLPITNASLNGQVVLGHCLTDVEVGCIEGLKSINQQGVTEELIRSGHAGQQTLFNEDASIEFPRGSSYPIWTSSDQTRYVLSNKIEYSFTPQGNSWIPAPDALEVSLIRVSASNQISGPTATLSPNPSDSSQNLLGLSSLSADFIQHDSNTTFVLKIRLPKSLKGWLHGRLNEASVSQVTSQQSTSTSLTYEISAKPSVSNIAGGWLDWSSVPLLRESFYGPRIPAAGSIGIDVAGSSRSLDHYKMSEEYFGQKNVMERLQWSFRTASGNGQNQCSSTLNGLEGIISTNAAVYDDSVPKWDADSKSLVINVGSPHLDSKGNLSVGSYSASMPTSLVKCLWNLDGIPDKAVLSAEYSADQDQTLSLTVEQQDDWLNVSANGFHYSMPTLGLQFLPPTGRFGTTSPSKVSVKRVKIAGATTFDNQTTGLPQTGIGAVALNVTAVEGYDDKGYGFVTTYPCDSPSTPAPNSSNLNFSGGQTIPNAVIAPVSADGYICFSVTGNTDLLVDASGYFPTGPGFTSLTEPKRLIDTRSS